MIDIVHTVLSVLLAALLLATGGGKLARSSSSHAIRDALHVPAGRWRAIGVLEIGLVVAFVLGIWLRPWGLIAGAGVVVLLVGAIFTRIRAGGAQRRSGVLADVVVLLVGVVTLILANSAHA